MRLLSRSILFACVVFSTVLLCSLQVSAASIWTDIQENQNFSIFVQFVNDTNLQGQLNSTSCTLMSCPTLFLPDNDAMADVPSDVDKANFVQRHITKFLKTQQPLKATTSEWAKLDTNRNFVNLINFNTKLYRYMKPASIYGDYFLMTNGSNYLVNQAHLITPDVVMDNGVYHVIDHPLWPLGAQKSLDFYLSDTANLSITYKLWSLLVDRGAGGGKLQYYYTFSEEYDSSVATVFLPTNDAWNAIPAEMLTTLESDIPLLTEVMSAHFLYNQLVFTSWINHSTLGNFTTGMPNVPNSSTKPISFTQQGSNYVAVVNGVNANILSDPRQSNVPLVRCVVHHIDKPLSLVYHTVRLLLQTHAKQFLTQCDAIAACKEALDSGNFSVIAPNDDAMKQFSAANNAWGSYFVLNSVSNLINMWNGQEYATADNQRVRYRSVKGQGYIDLNLPEGGYFPARIVHDVIPGKNGNVLVIDSLLCCNSRTVASLLEYLGSYSFFLGNWTVDTFKLTDANGRLTILVPDNDAFNTVLSKNALNKTLQRHVIVNDVNINTLKTLPDFKYEAATANYADLGEYLPFQLAADKNKVSITLPSKTVSFDLNTSGFRAQNGYVYPLSELLTKADD